MTPAPGPRRPFSLLLSATLLLYLATILPTVSAQQKQQKYTGALKYQPSLPGNAVVGVVYLVLSLIFFWHVWRHRSWWALCLPIGALTSSAGFFIRCTMDPLTVTVATYAPMMLLVVLSPAAWLAFNYMLYGRWIAAIDPHFGQHNDNDDDEEGQKRKTQHRSLCFRRKREGPLLEPSRYSFIPPRLVGRIFIWSDVSTFIIQGAAGGIQSASNNTRSLSMRRVGDQLFLAGVTMQGISYILFSLLITVAVLRLRDVGTRTPDNNGGSGSGSRKRAFLPASHPIMTMFFLFAISSVCIIIRSIFRIVEFQQGYDGYLSSHEIYLFVLDSLPLILAIAVWAIYWPTILLDRGAKQVRHDLGLSSSDHRPSDHPSPSPGALPSLDVVEKKQQDEKEKEEEDGGEEKGQGGVQRVA